MATKEGRNEKWYFTKEQLLNTPSRKNDIDVKKELRLRQNASNLIHTMGQKLKVSQLCINTATVYLHRFYMYHSFSYFPGTTMATAALFLAAKVEEQPKKIECLLKTLHECNNTAKPTEEQLKEEAQELVFNENILLQTLGFDVKIEHPHSYVVKFCQLINANQEFARASYFVASHSVRLTTMCLQYEPTIVACICVYIVFLWSKTKISNLKISENAARKPWFWYIAKTANLELIEEITQEVLPIFENSPSARTTKKMCAANQGANMNYNNLPSYSSDSSPQKESNDDSSLSNCDEKCKKIISLSSMPKKNYFTEISEINHKFNNQEDKTQKHFSFKKHDFQTNKFNFHKNNQSQFNKTQKLNFTNSLPRTKGSMSLDEIIALRTDSRHIEEEEKRKTNERATFTFNDLLKPSNSKENQTSGETLIDKKFEQNSCKSYTYEKKDVESTLFNTINNNEKVFDFKNSLPNETLSKKDSLPITRNYQSKSKFSYFEDSSSTMDIYADSIKGESVETVNLQNKFDSSFSLKSAKNISKILQEPIVTPSVLALTEEAIKQHNLVQNELDTKEHTDDFVLNNNVMKINNSFGFSNNSDISNEDKSYLLINDKKHSKKKHKNKEKRKKNKESDKYVTEVKPFSENPMKIKISKNILKSETSLKLKVAKCQDTIDLQGIKRHRDSLDNFNAIGSATKKLKNDVSEA